MQIHIGLRRINLAGLYFFAHYLCAMAADGWRHMTAHGQTHDLNRPNLSLKPLT